MTTNSFQEEAIKICLEYQVLVKSMGFPLISYWMIQKEDLEQMPPRFRDSILSFEDIRALNLLEKESVLSFNKLPDDRYFPPDIDYEDLKNFDPPECEFRKNILISPGKPLRGEPFPPHLLSVRFNREIVKEFLNNSNKYPSVDLSADGWVNKLNGEFQFPNGKVHCEKAKVKKQVFIEMMDLFSTKGVIKTSTLAEKVGLDKGRVRTEIKQISNKMKFTVKYEIISEGKGYYEIREFTG